MGLAYFDWSVSLSLGAGLIFAVVALLVTVRMTVDLPSLHQSPTEESAPIIRSEPNILSMHIALPGKPSSC